MIMKKVFFSLVMIFAATGGVKAQEVPIVTLQKGETTQLFYGADAYKEAMAAAENGNTIILGPSTFNATDITKAVSIYGNGYVMHSSEATEKEGNIAYATRINGDFTIALDSVNGQPAEGLYIEGIYSNNRVWVKKHLASASFIKCRFQNFALWKSQYNNDMTTSKDVQFNHCRFAAWFEPGESQNMSISNCIVNALGRNRDTSTINIQNCIIFTVLNNLRATLKNNIIYRSIHGDYDFEYSSGSFNPLHPACSVYNNVFCTEGDFLSNVITKDNNWLNVEYNTLLNKDIQIYSDDEMYELTNEAQTAYLGTDGTQVGIYGNVSPFNTTLTIPHIISKKIAPKTENGKLKVNIKVEIGDNTL